jgi:hypothetical protein
VQPKKQQKIKMEQYCTLVQYCTFYSILLLPHFKGWSSLSAFPNGGCGTSNPSIHCNIKKLTQNQNGLLVFFSWIW